MNTSAKTAPGETLTYGLPDFSWYDGEQFCLRITMDDMELDRCFFVYVDERFESYSLRKLFQVYFLAPGPAQHDEMADWLEPWLGLDPTLPKKLMLLRQMFARVREGSGRVAYHINHGPAHVNLDDSVRSHLGTSVFEDGSFNDKILDVVLEFRVDDQLPPELDQWALFPPVQTSDEREGASTEVDRRLILKVVMGLAAVVLLPLFWLGCRGKGGRNGAVGGFQGGAL